MRRVLFVTRVVQSYRVPFHDAVRAMLARQGVRYDLVQGEAEAQHRLKLDTIQVEWARVVRNRLIGFGAGKCIWQPLLRDAHGADLLIVGQENKYLLNYLLHLGRGSLFGKVALWGHGRNFQSRRPTGLAERWKRFWATRCDWWFAYTDETRRHVESLGFPADRITVFNNAVDTADLLAAAERTTPARLAARRGELGLAGRNVGVFVGGLYPDKRPDFLVAAADRVRAAVPDFELIVVGGGVSRPTLDAAASTRPWLKLAGPRFGADKVELMLLAKLFLMPGLLGLAVLDAGALGLPVVTTAYPWHSPEIAYLEDGITGAIVREWESDAAYSAAIVALLRDEPRRRAMAARARMHVATFSIEAMARRFADGVLAALAA